MGQWIRNMKKKKRKQNNLKDWDKKVGIIAPNLESYKEGAKNIHHPTCLHNM